MAELSNTTLPIKHSTQRMPGVLRKEIYTLDDIELTEFFDDQTGKLDIGEVIMYNGLKVCTITGKGISVNMPMLTVTDHTSMQQHIKELQRLDQFLAAVYEAYRK